MTKLGKIRDSLQLWEKQLILSVFINKLRYNLRLRLKFSIACLKIIFKAPFLHLFVGLWIQGDDRNSTQEI